MHRHGLTQVCIVMPMQTAGSATNSTARSAIAPLEIRRRLKIACDDLYDDPHDAEARKALATLLVRITSPETRTATARDYVRRVRIACTDLYDEPTNHAAQQAILDLLQ